MACGFTPRQHGHGMLHQQLFPPFALLTSPSASFQYFLSMEYELNPLIMPHIYTHIFIEELIVDFIDKITWCTIGKRKKGHSSNQE